MIQALITHLHFGVHFDWFFGFLSALAVWII